MIMPRKDKAEKETKPPTPRSLLLSIERHLREVGTTSRDTAYEAQQLVYDAWEAQTDERERELIREALELDPTNVDALLTVARDSGLEGEEGVQVLRQIVALGEENLGPKAFKGYAGAFWGFIETRPYMRARQELAETLRWAGRLDEAIAEWEAMLELNPKDNQGVRYSLLAYYLALNRLDAAQRLLAKYDECEFNAVFAWGCVLERFLSGDSSGASEALAVARKQNAHMQVFVKGHRRPPCRLPDAYSPGSKDEAACFAQVLQAAWERHPEALRWLNAQR